jgi:hypothetical protein
MLGVTTVKFTRVVLLCNLCWQDTGGDVETPAVRTLIFKTSDETDDFFRVDVCQNHAENGVSLDEILAAAEAIDLSTPPTHKALGRPRKAAALDMTASGDDPFHSRLTPCPECSKTYRGAGGIAVHMKAKHPDAWDQIVLERNRETERKRAQAALDRMSDAVPTENGK